MMIAVKINGKPVLVKEGTSIIEAARSLHINIPSLCHEPGLKPLGNCRVCAVEVLGRTEPVLACTTQVEAGMEILTESELAVTARKEALNVILSRHPLKCMTCAKSGDCLLQDYCQLYGLEKSTIAAQPYDYPIDDSNPFFERDQSKCILCGKCVQVCNEIVGAGAIQMVEINGVKRITPTSENTLHGTSCLFCGNCSSVCPVGALNPKSKTKYRKWEVTETLTTCPYCGTGCQMILRVKDGQVVEVQPANGMSNEGKLCVKGKFGFNFIHHPDRLKTPLIRKNGQLVESSWEEAYNLIAEKLTAVKEEYGPDAIGGLSSARCTNEENYLMQKFMRAVIGTNNIDHCARL